jgi:hypothetical protein
MTTTKTRKSKTTTTTPTVVEKLPPNPFLFEVLDLVSKQRTNAKKVDLLKEYAHDSLKVIFVWNYDESVVSLLPEGDVPYGNVKEQNVYSGSLSDNLSKEAKGGESATGQDLDGRGRSTLRRDYANLYHYVKGGNDSLSKIRREMMFINLLESLHPREAELLCLVKDKRLEEKYKIGFENVKQAYPDIQWGGRS